MVSVSQSALATLYSAPRVVLCEDSLYALFHSTIETRANVLRYSQGIIGDKDETGVVPLREIGLPVGLELVVAPSGCQTAGEILSLIADSGFPRQVPLIEIKVPLYKWYRKGGSRFTLLSAYQKAIDRVASTLQTYTREREEEVVILRRRVEAQLLVRNHLSSFLETLGYACQELFMENIPETGSNYLSPPIDKKLPTILSDISGVSIFSAPSDSTATINIALEINGREVVNRVIEIGEFGGWNDVFFPEAFLRNNQDAVLTIHALKGEPKFARAEELDAQRMPCLPDEARSAAIRIWRHNSPRIHPLCTAHRLMWPSPRTVNRQTLESGMKLGEGNEIDQYVSLGDGYFVQTHPMDGALTNFILRDIDITNVTSFETCAVLAHPKATAVRFLFLLVPKADDDDVVYAKLRQGADNPSGSEDVVMCETTLSGMGSQVLTLSTIGLDPRVPYNLVLAAQSAVPATSFAWARWSYVACCLNTMPARQTYRYADLASLYSLTSFADGPFVENALNERLGFPILTMTDGDRFLQIHPVEGEVIAARIDAFIPKGTQRFWVEIANEHGGASPTEFGVVMTPVVAENPFTKFYADNGISELPDDHICRLEDGGYLKKTVLGASETGTLDIFLVNPLDVHAHLYLYVRVREGHARYGWCRWHRLAMTIFAEGNQ